MPRLPALLLTAVLLSLPAFAGFAPENPIAPPVYGPAVGEQVNAVVGSDGQNFLAVWLDGREGRDGIYAARLSSGGTLLDPTNIRIPVSSAAVNRRFAGVFSIGGTWIVLWSEQIFTPEAPEPQSNVMVVRLDGDGRIIDGPRVAIPDAYAENWRSAATNGPRILVTYAGNQYALLDENAELLRRDLALPFAASTSPIVASNGSDFMIVAFGLAIRVDSNGDLESPPVQFVSGSEMPIAVASDGNGYLVITQNWVNRQFLARDISTASIAAGTPLPSLTGTPQVTGDLVWAGNSYVFATGSTVEPKSSPAYQQEFGIRIDGSATPLDNAPFPISDAANGSTTVEASIASNGNTVASVWHSASPVSGNDTFATIVNVASLQRSGPILLSRCANQQTNPSIAFSGRNYLAAWQETTGMYVGRISLDGQPLDGRGIQIAPWGEDPNVVFDGENYIVGWITNGNLASTLWISRISPDGQILDGHGVPIASSPCAFSFDLLAADGGTIAAWDECDFKAIHVELLDRAAQPIGVPLAVTPPQMETAMPRMAWNGNEYLIAFQEQIPIPSTIIGPPFVTYASNIRAVRLSSELTVIDTEPLPIAVSDSEDQNPYAASSGDGFVIGWTSNQCTTSCSSEVRTRDVAGDGTLAAATDIATGNLSSLIWDGSRYALAYAAGGNIFVTHGGDRDQLASSATPDDESMPQLVATGIGNVAAAYVRVATEPLYGGVARVFMRQWIPPRRRPATGR